MRSVVVVDTNIMVKWVVNMPDSDTAKKLLTDWIKEGRIVPAPALLTYEACNALYKYVRAGHISLEDALEGLDQVILPGIKLDFSAETTFNNRALELAYQFKLPATYDAYYLALAEREKCDFWTSDARLWKAVHTDLPWVHNLNEYSTS
jgi:predicted nucleic acid-binding protein